MITMYQEEFKSLLAKLRPVIGELADTFWLASLLDPEQARDVQAVAQALAAELLNEDYQEKHLLLEPPGRNGEGEYTLGTVIYAGKPVGVFGLRETDLPQHLLILGRSGAGKTNVGYILAWTLLRAGKPFLVFDYRRNYRHFLRKSEGKDILLFPLGEDESLSFNPLSPPASLSSSQREAYVRDVVSTICTTYLPGHQLLSTRGVEYLLLKALEFLDANDGKSLTFNTLRDYVERYKAHSREIDWKVSAQNVLYKLTTGPIGRLLNSQGPVTPADILNKPVIFELDGLGSETDRSLFTRTFLLWLYYHRLAEEKSATSKHALLIEEAHNIFRRREEGTSVHDTMIRQMRDLGQALVLLDQNPSLLSIPALGNTGVTICLNLKHGEDLKAAGKALTLPPEDCHHIGRLPVGNAIVRVPDRWPTPFLVRFPRFPVPEPDKSARINNGHAQGDSLQRLARETQCALNEAIRAVREGDRREKKEKRITEQERDFLVDVAVHPLSVVTERYGRLGWSAHTGTKIKRKLLGNGLIKQEKVSVPNGSVTLLKFTEKGRELMAARGVKVKALPKNASLEHEYWKELVAQRYREKGYKVEKEVPIGGGQAVDLVAIRGDHRIAIEIETGKSNPERNVGKCREAGFKDVRIVNTGGKLLQGLPQT